MNGFEELPDLAARRLGGMVLAANDEFFAPKENLLKPEPPAFDPDRYTDRGKEMDGWESRRRRTPGHDWCVIRLGAPGIVRGVVVDTSHFRGNYPDRCSLQGTVAEDDAGALGEDAEWFELLEETALQGDSRNGFEIGGGLRVTHLRLAIHPDGGVARLRVHGEPLPDLRRMVDARGAADLAGTLSGGMVLDASDRFFSSPHNLLAPGDSHGMHDGWETKRRRGPGHDWVVVRLAAEGALERFEIDTSNFKGNYPDTCEVEGAVAPADAGATDLKDAEWTVALPRHRLQPHHRHLVESEPVTATHVRLSIHPDGGVARLRVHATVTDQGWRAFGARWLDASTPARAERDLLACCGSTAWARAVAQARPFGTFDRLVEAADDAWARLGRDDVLEAFAAHPRIGDRGGSAWSRTEQAGVSAAAEDVTAALAAGNREYEERFGHVFLVNATGRSAAEMLRDLRRRLANEPDEELREAAEQQRQITRIRLEKLVRPASLPPPAPAGA